MLKNKVAVITGSTSGIGEGCARALAKEGCHLVINGFGDASEIEALRASFEADYGITCLYSPADMTKPDEIAEMFEMTVRELGGVDILINNAGIQYVSPIAEFPTEKWDAIIAINLSSAFHTMHHAIPIMTKRGWGRIINTASAHALVASPNKSAYVAAKHGIAGLTKTAALEVARDNITVNAICPGYVWTPLVEKQIPDTARTRGMTEEEVINDVMLASAATKKFTSIEQVAALALFLCGEAAENITGSLQVIDGGWTAQ
ncbi:3-hydroxybutyrate dehydrogenase [Sneathiella chungangensis]|uniref:3-hydroxybutyrate dehydrogenase n=1 Tax=Sneathiella chungangensis TaxID=1418234 RepID=A0A845MI42_9PROT|nr:3-hydroxybutyrate dehydrogenase [Sneathiella chungangensis]MZR23411.1 3-hydroxybutyrate dehydrogenase [Sneathiella chungangensis]